MTQNERSGVLGVVRDDLVDGVQNGNYRVTLEVPGRVLLPTWQVAHEVPQRVAPCVWRRDGETENGKKKKKKVCGARWHRLRIKATRPYLSGPYSSCPWPGFGERWPRLAPLCPRLSAAALPGLAALSPF